MTLTLSIILKIKAIRRRVLSILKCKYFHELDLSIPLGNGIWADLLEADSYDSFSEIFIQKEYDNYLPETPIRRILDIGANYGYFSLWLQCQFPESKIFSLMIEPSHRCSKTLNKLILQKSLMGRYSYLRRMIGTPEDGEGVFFDRPHMSGSSFQQDDDANEYKVKILNEEEVKTGLQPPYDLIKCDIEGSELELITNYKDLIKSTKYILLEWHSWHNGKIGYSQIVDQLRNCNFEILKSSPSIPCVGRDGEVGLLLAKNLSLES